MVGLGTAKVAHCDQCKCAEAEYRRDRRRVLREQVGEFVPSPVGASYLPDSAATRENGESVPANVVQLPLANAEAAVRSEIEALGPNVRPGLAAVCIAMARRLDNPKAISSQLPAAGRLMQALDKLQASSLGRRGSLRLVRAMTEKGGAETGPVV